MLHLKVITILVITVIISCRSSNPHGNSIEQFTSLRMRSAEIDYNQSKDIALCYEKETNTAGLKKFEVIRVKDNLIIEEGSFRPGYIKWINNYEIELLDLPGALKENQDLNQFKKIISIPSIKTL